MNRSWPPLRHRHQHLKTVNVPADYLHAEFEDLYMSVWKSGLKGLATYRSSPTGCQVL